HVRPPQLTADAFCAAVRCRVSFHPSPLAHHARPHYPPTVPSSDLPHIVVRAVALVGERTNQKLRVIERLTQPLLQPLHRRRQGHPTQLACHSGLLPRPVTSFTGIRQRTSATDRPGPPVRSRDRRQNAPRPCHLPW